jgi:sigma-B regulation protein RsbU (phosphoserine phosphatase)
MFCNACGREMTAEETSCSSCGHTVVPAGQKSPMAQPRGKVKAFWNRVTEGQAVNQLWSELTADARTSYRFYDRDIHREALEGRSKVRRFFRYLGLLFWAIVTKLTPARRVALLAGLVLLFWPAAETHIYGGLLILLVLVFELADRVTMKRDLQIAREIQLWLVPEVPPLSPKLDIAFTTRPANTVAGDYYDVFPIGKDGAEGRVLIVIADVVGKSIPAALLMATFQASLRTLAESGCPLAELTAGLNRYLSAHSSGGLRFTTAFLGELDAGTGCLNYINAGHNAPVLLRASGSSVERLEAGGVPLGISPEARYDSGTVTVCPGDLVVLFTDGVVEAVNDREEEYGEARLLSFLHTSNTETAGEVLRRLMQQVEAFVGGAPQHDDMTCVVLRCK